MSKQVEPSIVMKFLNDLFCAFDLLIDEHQVQKVRREYNMMSTHAFPDGSSPFVSQIETAGDCYIVAAGVLSTGADGYSEVLSSHDPRLSASRILNFAQSMLYHSRLMKMPHNGDPVLIRIGVHTGDCVSGLIGSRLHKFGLFGECRSSDHQELGLTFDPFLS